ncbi:MAG TPA: hypothetical protein P5123_07025, partial [Spirochaetota bacterium]|nr:hypothetical protein [Spirochaetota bacterium]
KDDIIKEKKDKTVPVLIGVFVFLVVIINTKLGIDKHSSSYFNPITWAELFKCIPLLALLSIAASVATYLYRSYIMKHNFSDYSICIKCEKVYRNKKNVKAENMMICKCGGTVVNLNRVKWVDDENY